MKLFVICLSLFFSAATPFNTSILLDSCPDECGDVKIPFPFGIQRNCSLSDEFLVNCNQSFSPPRPIITMEGMNLYIRKVTLIPAHIYGYYDKKIFNDSRGGSTSTIKEWKIGKQDCITAMVNQSSYACKEQGKCLNSVNGVGYTCICSVGYRGNPYLLGGCTDIHGTIVEDKKNCTFTCMKAHGDVSSSNPQEANSTKGESTDNIDWISILASSTVDALMASLSTFLAEKGIQKFVMYRFRKKITELKKRTNSPEIFSHKDMVKGCQDRAFVATSFMSLFPNQIDAITDRIASFSSMEHRNIQKLKGCCLETRVPTLIFELFAARSLCHYLHENDDIVPLSLKTRIRIAAKVADAIALLHSSMPEPVVYREMKSSNILLDNSCSVKVSIESSTMWLPLNRARKRALVKEKNPYLDPEFTQSGTLTDKSDVYGYGVLLVELLIGKNPMVFHTSNENEHLSTYFLRKMKESHLLEILDPLILIFTEEEEKQITSVAELAVKCLATKGVDRPSMKDIAEEFERLKHEPYCNLVYV